MEVALAGQCTLEVQTTPPGAALEIAPLVMDADGTQLGSGSPVNFELLYSPLRGLRLPKGTYLIKMQLEGIPELVCPVTLKHGEQKSVWYDLPKAIPAGTAYVPGGICLIGGKASPYRRELEVDVKPFFISLYEVTNGEYLEFWLSLDGVRERGVHQPGYLDGGRNVAFAAWDGFGKSLQLKREHPVVGISREAAEAYCQWLGRKLHLLCRLPTVEEWRRRLRDGLPSVSLGIFVCVFIRVYPRERGCLEEYGRWAPPGSFPADISYGVFDMAGNVREWTASEAQMRPTRSSRSRAQVLTPSEIFAIGMLRRYCGRPFGRGLMFAVPGYGHGSRLTVGGGSQVAADNNNTMQGKERWTRYV